MEPGASVSRLRRELAMRGLTFRGRIPHSNVVSVATNGRDPVAAIRLLDDAVTVVDATPNYVRRAFEVPDDPYVGSARPYFDAIRLTQAWDLSHGAGDVVIAVVDTGVSPVADLADRLLPGHNFVQDDDATFDSEPAPDPGDTRDTSAVGHGTLVAGIAAAMTNNGVGIAGVAGTRTCCRSRC
jgi:subtilisin family serine protease